jgi:hypothetical protein
MNSFTVTTNGTYTARLATNDDYWMMCTFTIDKIKNVRPTTPTINKLKRGSTRVSGTAGRGMEVVLKIGNRTYKATKLNSKGKWSVKTSRLFRKQKISCYAVNGAGTKSKTRRATVK